MEHNSEISRIRAIAAAAETLRVHDLLARQLDVLHQRCGVLLTFCTVVITTTGFSGRLIAGTNLVAQLLIISGLLAVLGSAWMVLVSVLRIRWITGELDPHDDEAILKLLKERDRRSINLRYAIHVAMVGMTLYVAALCVMLAYPEAAALAPMR